MKKDKKEEQVGQAQNISERQRERREYKEKIRKHRIKNRMIGVGITVGLVLCIAGVHTYQRNRTFENYNIMWENEMEKTQKDRCASWGKYVLQYSNDGAFCIDDDGSVLWSISYEMLEPTVSIQGDYAVIMDCKGTKFYICNKEKGVTGNSTTPYTIRQGKIATQGTVAIMCEKDSISYIYYYKSTGDKLDVEVKATMERVGYPLTMAISPDGKSLVVSYLYVEGGGMQNKLVFYDFSSETSENVAGTFSHYSDSDTMIPTLVYADNEHVVAVGDNRLTFYQIDLSGKGRIPSIAKEITVENQIISMFAENECIGFVWEQEVNNNSADGANIIGEKVKLLTLYDSIGEIIFQEEINFNYDNIMYNGVYIVLYNDTECIMYAKNGTIKYENTFFNGISQILQGPSSKEFYLIIGGTIQKIRLV